MTSPAITLLDNPIPDLEEFPSMRTPRLGVEFLTSLNHAIRTPMSGILGLSELMLENPLDAENREYLNSIRSCASALNDLLSATLDYAAHAAGAVWLEEQDFPLMTAIEAGLRDARQRADDNGSVFEPELVSGLDKIVRADALRLRDLISLVARVAIHSASNGRVGCRIALAPWGGNYGELILEAWREAKPGSQLDHFPRRDLAPSEELLGDSFRIETLEIALVHHLAKLLRGSVEITSEPGLPIAVRVLIPMAFSDAGVQEDRAGESTSRRAILIADDNQISLRVLSSILTRADFEIVAVGSGPAAVEACSRRSFDLVLLDLAMPGMDGDITTALIRELPQCEGTPVLGITAGVAGELRESCRRNGMNAILAKPVDAGELVASVRFHMQHTAPGTGCGGSTPN